MECTSEYTLTHADGSTESFTVRGNPPIIADPGKFEGEPVWVPYFWAIGLSGFADRDSGAVYGFNLTPEDRARFPELKGRRTVRIGTNDSGFVYSI